MFTIDEIFAGRNKETREQMMRQNLMENDDWAVRALIVVAERQTTSEFEQGVTQDRNGVGFGAFDAQFLTDLAKKAKENLAYPPDRRFHKCGLSPKQMICLRKSIGKYAGQVLEVAKEKALAKKLVMAG